MCPIGRTKPFFRPTLSSDRAGIQAFFLDSIKNGMSFSTLSAISGAAPYFLAVNL